MSSVVGLYVMTSRHFKVDEALVFRIPLHPGWLQPLSNAGMDFCFPRVEIPRNGIVTDKFRRYDRWKGVFHRDPLALVTADDHFC